MVKFSILSTYEICETLEHCIVVRSVQHTQSYGREGSLGNSSSNEVRDLTAPGQVEAQNTTAFQGPRRYLQGQPSQVRYLDTSPAFKALSSFRFASQGGRLRAPSQAGLPIQVQHA